MPDRALFGTGSATICVLMISHALKYVWYPCFILMWGPWRGSWLQLARSHRLCTFVSLQGNYQVKELDLSHNEFSEKGGQLLGQMLGNLIYYSHKARTTGTGGLDGFSTVNMYFLLQQKCPMSWWVVQKMGHPDLELPAWSTGSPSSPQVTPATMTNVSEHKCRMRNHSNRTVWVREKRDEREVPQGV